MSKIQNKYRSLILLSIIFFLSSFLTSNALSNEQLKVSITKIGTKISINESWNILSDGNDFKRTIPISKDDINNINMEVIFPYNQLIDFDTKYNQRDNSTILTSNINVKKGQVFVLNIKYQLDLDKITCEEFVDALPNSLFKDNSPTIENIKVSIIGNGEEKITSYNKSNGSDEIFTQETSKSQTINVIMLLLKIAFGIVFLFIFCTIMYAFIMYMYYKNIQRSRGPKFKHRKSRNIQVNKNKRIKISKKF